MQAGEDPGAAPREGHDLLAALLQGRLTLADLHGVSPESMEVLYAMGHAQYVQGRYDDALRAFLLMAVMRHADARTYKAIGSCLHMTGQHEQASKYYGVASMLDLQDPEPVWRMAQCQCALGHGARALKCLDFLDGLVAGKAPHATTAAKAKAMRRQLSEPAPAPSPERPA